jgi:two-component system response regulator YesN
MVIADDELFIRQGLQSIQWDRYDIELKGIASNGIEALSLVERTFPGILLTDIRMPGMDGLKLINAAKQIVPDIKSILLTGYQDFSYAHSAIQLGAIGYILKPSDPDETIQTVLKAKELFEAELARKYERERISRQVDGVRNILKNSFLLDLLYGRAAERDVIDVKCREFGLSFDNFIVMAFEAAFSEEETDSKVMARLKEEVCSISSNLNKVYVIDVNPTVVCAIVEFPPSERPEKDIITSTAVGIRNYLESLFHIRIRIGIGMRCNSALQLHESCNQALNCLKVLSGPEENSVIHINDLVDSLKGKNARPLHKGALSVTAEPVRNSVVRNILSFIDAHYMDDISLLNVSEYVYMNHIYLSRLIKKETGENFIDILTRVRMDKACEMLGDCSLRTYEIADRVGIRDSGYFSQVFRKHFGMTPSEYRENLLSTRG